MAAILEGPMEPGRAAIPSERGVKLMKLLLLIQVETQMEIRLRIEVVSLGRAQVTMQLEIPPAIDEGTRTIQIEILEMIQVVLKFLTLLLTSHAIFTN